MDINTTPIFYHNYNSKKKININRGWTRSWKTYNLLELFHFWLLTWKIDDEKVWDKWVLSIVRKFWSNLKWSCQRDFEEIMNKYWTAQLFDINQSNRTYQYCGRLIEFIGADDQQKLRWKKRDILYCNEANELAYNNEFFQLLIRTKYKIFIDFNPDDEDIWINTELEQKRRINEGDVRVIVSTYKDNHFLTEWEVKEIERLKHADPMFWQIFWLWQYGRFEGLVFEFEDIKEVPEEAEFLCYGQDFWFTNDPTTLVAIYRYNGGLIFDEIIYQTNLTNQDIVNKYKSLWLSTDSEIFADSAEPKSIEEIHRAWFNIKPVKKWPDSIKFWIDLMKQYKLFVTEKSMNTRKEFKKYSWKKDKNWKSLNEPIGEFNHCIDAIRYWVSMKLWNPNSIFVWGF